LESPTPIRPTRPTQTRGHYLRARVNVYCRITVQALTGYVSTTGSAVKAAVAAAIDALGIGETVLLSKLYTPMNASEPGAGVRTFDVLSVELGADPNALAPANVPIAFSEAAAAAGVEVVVAP